jgi:hypothetical protein
VHLVLDIAAPVVGIIAGAWLQWWRLSRAGRIRDTGERGPSVRG